MSLIFGAALIVAAMTVLHLGRLIVKRVGASAPSRESLVADILAVIFTALLGPGLLLLSRELMAEPDLLRLAGVAAALAASVVGSMLVAGAVRRATGQPASLAAAPSE